MYTFEFKEKTQKVESLCIESIELLSLREEQEIINLVSDFKQFLTEQQKQVKLTIGIIGQYSSGKSTIIAALTNAEYEKKYYERDGDENKLIEVYKIDSKELRIGVQITTDNTETYDWKEVLLIDTPGIHAGRLDHDDITREQISKTDLLIFVIPNELFNPQAGKFFRMVAKEMQRIGQMILVINKMSRETGTPKELIKTILQVVEPYHPNDFHTCFIDANSYLKAQHEKNADEKQFLIDESHFGDFVTSLDKLIERNHLFDESDEDSKNNIPRLVTPLHRVVDVIEQSLNVLTTEDKISCDFLEILRRKALILRASQTRLQNSFRAELNTLEHEIWKAGEKVANKVDGQHKEEEINTAIKNSELEMQSLSKKSMDEIQSLLKDELTRIQTEIEELQQSQLGHSLEEEFEVAGVGKKTIGEKTIEGKREIPPILKKGPEAFAKLGNFASKVSRDMVYKTVKFFGGKFKPWGATKAAKFINKLGPLLAGIGTILDIFFTAKEEKDKKKFEQQLLENRANIRQEFRHSASEMRNDFEDGYVDGKGIKYEGLNKVIFGDFYHQELADVEKQQNEFRQCEESKKDIVNQLINLLSRTKNEISSLTV